MWYLPWSESIKKRACRYLLQRYLGNFLEEKLTLDQLNVDLYNGTGTVCDVSLDCEALNELGDSQNWPLEIVDGYMKEITVTIPWSTLLKDDSVVEVKGLYLTVQPKIRTEPASSMLESMWSSMSSSMQLAEECLKEEPPPDTNPLEGIEMVAQAIDSVLNRVKIRFINSHIRIEHVPKNSDRGIALEIHIDSVDYFDEAGAEPTPEETDPDKSKSYVESTFFNKKIRFVGLSLYTDEFPSKLRTMARSLISERSEHSPVEKDNQIFLDVNYQSTSSDVFYETRSVMSAIETETFKDVEETQSTISEKSIEPNLEERSNQPDPILFAKITGQQDLSLRMRHTKEVDSPKVEIKMTMGSFIIFISPRQLHTLIELLNALNQPDLEDTSNIPLRASGGAAQCKPMQKADYQLIEAQLLRNFDMGHKYSGMQGWSGPGLEESDDGERFHPLTSPGANMAESFSSSVSSMNTSCTSSVSAPAQSRFKRNKKAPFVEGDPSADISLISLRIQSLFCVLLHKDILIPETIGSDCIRASTIEKMQKISKEFFEKLNFPPLTEGTKEEFYSAIDKIEKAAGRNHLRLITTEMSLDGSEKTTSHGSHTMCEASIKHALLHECLYTKSTEDNTVTPQSFDLIQFDWKEDEDSSKKSSESSRDNIKISFKQTSKYTRIAGEKKLLNPTTDISVKCMPFHVDVELSVIERMSATFFAARGSAASASPPPTVRSQNHCNLTLHSSLVHATLRFPIADLRSNVNREYRRVRNDFLVFKFLNSTINWQRVASSRPQPTAVTLKATTLDLYYYEDERIPGTHIARATMDECSDANILRGTSAPIPTITLTFQPAKTSSSPFDSMTEDHFQPAGGNPMTTSMYIMNNLKSTQPSPFSGKKMAHQSFTKHEGSPHTQEENLIVPGTEEEMTEFTNSSVDLSSIHLDFNLPILSLQLESKQLYEILYNRINSDLLLWEPHLIDPYEYNEDVYGPINPAFGACKGSLYDSDSGNTSSEEDNMYYSTYDNKLKKGIGKSYEKKDTHNFCLTFKTGKGLLTIYAPVRDSNKRVVPGQMGEMVLEAHKLSMCHVSGLYGQPKSGQMCLRSGRITLYHEATITIPSEKPSLRIFGSTLPSHLKSTIHSSGKGVAIKEQLSENDMFSLALKVDPDKENSNLKAICIALGIEQASLRHRGDKGIAWLTQLMDVLDVIDYPVPGYTPSTVVSELHVHILDCAIDYRPLYLPIRTVLTLGNFAVSSNVITETNTSCLRFLAQECTLFIMNVTGSKPLVAVPLDDDKLPNIKRDYVCVVDVGLFELSLRMEDKENKSREQPQVDLSASNNLISIYSCWDSASALCRLVTYAASDGDSQPPYVPSSRHTSICSDQPIETLVGLEDRPVEEVRELSPSELQQVNDLMAEAMKESPNTTLQEEDFNSSVEKEGVEVFFFPDESNMTKKQTSMDSIENDTEMKHFDYEDFCSGVTEDFQETKPTNVQVATELGDPSTTPKPTPRKSKRKNRKSNCEGNNTDDEYCIIESQPQVVDSDLEEPVVKWFGSGPLPLIEQHFTIPPERTDVLKAPKSFPMPLFRYTLCEMSVMWHMYGGSDFSRGEVVPAKKTVKIDEKARKQGSPRTTKRGDKEYEPYEEERETTAAYRSRGVSWAAGSDKVQPGGTAKQLSRDWREIGGPMREHSVCVMLSLNKVKFQHEIYPPGGVHASRHTLAIHKIEILDRLSCSRINKMLTIYNLNDEPERINAYMLVVKACHLKPDPTLSAQECCLKISMLPLRFSIDQDTLAFLISFFTKLGTDEINDDECKSLGGISCESGGSKHATPTHRPPVMSIASHLRDPPPTPTSLGDADSLSLNENMNREDEPLMETYEAERLVNENLIQLEEDFQKLALGHDKPAAKTTVNCEPLDDSPIYFRRIVFSPDVPIRLDYVGKRVDLSAGPVAGLLMGLGHLNCSELTLKRLDYRLGLLGVEKLIQWALREWLTDIKRHQLPGLLSGIGPMRSLLQFVTGICDLVWLPVEQWRRDGRLVYGLRRGAASFTARTAVAALDITTRLLHLIQATAETAFDMLTPGPTLQLQDAYERREQRRRRRRDPARHVADLRDGVASAYHTVREGFAEQAATMALAARSSSGAGVLRHLPGAAVAPLALAAAGAADVLGGVRAHLEPHRARDHADRWRPLPDKPSE